MSYRYQTRKLTKADGERILWHVLFHLQAIEEFDAAHQIYLLMEKNANDTRKK